ncbi:MAG TPA: protein kinase [Thermoanaerobaculia bacterium]|jgi:serine/threonine protein kinase|nr:protein kinase [Thermoanaerobaculia bacterium]
MSVLPEIESRFDVIAMLGEGGMGTVYKVRHRDLDEVQIVKTLKAHLSSKEGLRERFINEARRGMRLRHPHIAGVHDFAVCADGTGYIVMEYVHGHNLRDLLATRGAMRLPLVGAIATQTLDALGYLHSEKFIHRDISPDNLILTMTADGDPFVKLIDLGISKSLEAGQTMTETGQFIGKVSYASPEQFGGHADARSDLYSLGVVLYKLLTNADPFPGENYNQIIAGHLFQPPRPFEEAAPGIEIPEAVQHVVYRALEKDPDKRYRDAAEFCEAVEEAFGIEAPRTTRPAPTRPAITRPGHTDGATTLVPLTDKTVVSEPPTQVETTLVATPERQIPWRLVSLVAALALLAAVSFAWYRMRVANLASYGKFYAIVIGESQYQKHETLPTAVNDARAVAQLLESKYGYEVTRLENAGGQQIVAALQGTAKRMTNADNLLVYYAGHGTLLNDKGYWLPVDADLEMTNWISPAMIKDLLLDHPARRTLVIADSCYSGAIARGTLSTAYSRDRKEKRSRIVISSGGNAPIIDSADGQHSLFTRALLDTLGDPDDSVSSVQDLFARIRERVNDSARRAGREQNPDLAVMAEVGDEGGTYFFVSR